ncbi:MAG: hypothetical protein J1G38_01920 [Clostridiales bacterium]|nr:hypothetical protein [Clostridiales bacterium]
MNNSSWTIEQTKKLFALCDKAKKQGTSLSSAFSEMARLTDRSVNSVRNYYYGQAKTFELVPEIAAKLGIKSTKIKRDAFVPFEAGEIRELIEKVLVGKANGKSIRATIFEMANGDAKVALRLQNKYRSVLRSHRDEVEAVMNELSERGVSYVNPYSRADKNDNFVRLTEYIASLDSSKVGSFLSLIEKLK